MFFFLHSGLSKSSFLFAVILPLFVFSAYLPGLSGQSIKLPDPWISTQTFLIVNHIKYPTSLNTHERDFCQLQSTVCSWANYLVWLSLENLFAQTWLLQLLKLTLANATGKKKECKQCRIGGELLPLQVQRGWRRVAPPPAHAL